ncbi:MAG: hypothetical protein MZV63_28925 [Marinilabiliales bacterium]|nr:hypothetical protein [Marinilabiliales bacterium]
MGRLFNNIGDEIQLDAQQVNCILQGYSAGDFNLNGDSLEIVQIGERRRLHGQYNGADGKHVSLHSGTTSGAAIILNGITI